MAHEPSDIVGNAGSKQSAPVRWTGRQVTRRQVIKAGGLAALGLVFSKPIIDTIRPTPIFAQYGEPEPPFEPPPAPEVPEVGKILFPGSLNGAFIFSTLNPDDGTVQPIPVNHNGATGWPALSNDGSRISFRASVQVPITDWVIFAANIDGSGKSMIPDTFSATEGKHSWSPDNTKIAVSREVSGRPPEVFLVNVDGTGSERIWLGGDAFDPAWSPDGGRIAFRSHRTGQAHIFLANIDGSEVTQLTNLPDGSNVWPDWSPDGTKLLFTHHDIEIYVINVDGSGLRLLAKDNQLTTASWSLDGARIAYSCELRQDNEILNGKCIINSDGSGEVTSYATRGGVHIDWGR